MCGWVCQSLWNYAALRRFFSQGTRSVLGSYHLATLNSTGKQQRTNTSTSKHFQTLSGRRQQRNKYIQLASILVSPTQATPPHHCAGPLLYKHTVHSGTYLRNLLQNVFVVIANCICTKLTNVFVHFACTRCSHLPNSCLKYSVTI